MRFWLIYRRISQVKDRGRGIVSTSFYIFLLPCDNYKTNKLGGIILDKKLQLLTNNSLVKEKYCSSLNITFVDGQYIDVLKSARDMIHKGCKLVTHPLMGSVKPNETPYRSIIVSEGNVLDVESLTIIESSIAVTEKFLRDNRAPRWEERILEDFRFVDLKLIESAIDSITK